MIKITHRELRRLIREEIGHNFKTKDNDPYQYYETSSDIQVNMYPTDKGFSIEIDIPEDSSLSTHTRTFPTEAECNLYARNYVDYARKILSQRKR